MSTNSKTDQSLKKVGKPFFFFKVWIHVFYTSTAGACTKLTAVDWYAEHAIDQFRRWRSVCRSHDTSDALCVYWAGPLAASNIFFLPSIPDMASTFFLQSLSSTGLFCAETQQTVRRRVRDGGKEWELVVIVGGSRAGSQNLLLSLLLCLSFRFHDVTWESPPWEYCITVQVELVYTQIHTC